MVEPIAFSHVPRYLVSKERSDDKKEQYYNLTQLSMDGEVNAQIRLCTNYHVAVIF